MESDGLGGDPGLGKASGKGGTGELRYGARAMGEGSMSGWVGKERQAGSRRHEERLVGIKNRRKVGLAKVECLGDIQG